MKLIILLFGLLLPFTITAQQVAMGYGVILDPQKIAGTVKSALPNSPSDKAGLKMGDILLSLNGKPTTSMDNNGILAAIKKENPISIILQRGTERKTIKMQKAPFYTFDRTCITGNCVNGRGTAVMLLKGNAKYVGEYTNGVMTQGSIYLSSGALEAFGKFDSEGRLISGSFITTKRWQNGYLNCNDIRYDSSGKFILNGAVTVHEISILNGRILMEGTYVNGKKEGMVKEWDYENGVQHQIRYTNDLPQSGTIYSLTNNAFVAKDVSYLPHLGYDDAIGYISRGTFDFGNGSQLIDTSPGGYNISTLKELFGPTSPGSKTTTLNPANVVKPTQVQTTANNNAARNTALANCNLTMQTLTYYEETYITYAHSIDNSNYDEMVKNMGELRMKIINLCNKALHEYRDVAPANALEQFRRSLKAAEDMHIPSRRH